MRIPRTITAALATIVITGTLALTAGAASAVTAPSVTSGEQAGYAGQGARFRFVTATFTLQRPAHAVSVYGENRSIAPDQGGARFKDTYAAYQAHVYKIN